MKEALIDVGLVILVLLIIPWICIYWSWVERNFRP